MLNTNAIHQVLNAIGLIIAVLIGFDYGGLGLSPELVSTILAWALLADKIVKFGINITRDGLSGLFKVQPPVK